VGDGEKMKCEIGLYRSDWTCDNHIKIILRSVLIDSWKKACVAAVLSQAQIRSSKEENEESFNVKVDKRETF